MYVELHAASAFSFLEAASNPEALVDRAAALGYPALALLDRDGVYGIPRFHMAARQAGIRALVGAELTIKANGQWKPAQDMPVQPGRRGGRRSADRVAEAGPMPGWSSPHPPFLWRLPVLVASREGYRNLCRLITRMKLRAPKGEGSLQLEDFEGFTSGLIALAGRATLTGYRYGVGGLLDRLVGLFGRTNVYVELQRHLQRDEEADNEALRTLASAFRVPVIATNGVRFATPDERPLFDVLTCVRHKTDVHRAGQRLARNAEHYLKSPAQMAQLFSDVPEAVAATRELADRLEYTMADLGYRFPEYPVPPGETMSSFLRKVTEVGARDRYRPYHERARAQIARELDLIEKLDLAGYFLIVWDLVNFCRQHGILVQGRGSAANSAVCYSLGITAVDPVGMELLFERFLSEERGEWPDIDLDLPSGDRREQVIQYVYQRYGAMGAAMTANVITYRGRSAAREVGKALGIDAGDIDRLAKMLHTFEWRDPKESLTRNLRDVGLDPADDRFRQFAELWARIQHLPRHLGQHSGGMVICQGRLDEIVPLENASMPGRVVIQWDKDDCADLGLVKVDLLGLGMMAVLQDALAIVNGTGPRAGAGEGARLGIQAADSSADGRGSHRRAGGPPLDLAHLPPDDPHVYRMLQEADTIGIFQVESRAQMATLPRLRPTCFYDLVVEVAIIRPGPIVGQMVHPYLSRRKGDEPVTYPHPSLEPVLKRTLGVPLFQEQLLRIAMVAADFSGGEAEELRRAMGFKRSEERMRKIEVKLRAGMARNGIVGEEAERILLAITSFALYGFPESHAASFALLVYASAYLKTYFPAAFYAALLNNQPMGFYHPATLVKDAQRRGVRFLPIDVQRSPWDCTVEPDGAVRLGLRFVQGLRAEVGEKIAGARGAPGARGAHGASAPGARSAQGAASGSHGAHGAHGAGAQGAGAPGAQGPGAPGAQSTTRTGTVSTSGTSTPSTGAGTMSTGERTGSTSSTLSTRTSSPLSTASTPSTQCTPSTSDRTMSTGERTGSTASTPSTRTSSTPSPASTPSTDMLPTTLLCPKCGSDDERMIEREQQPDTYFCNLCAHLFVWTPQPEVPTATDHDATHEDGDAVAVPPGGRFASIEELIAVTGIRRDELATLARIGALNAFGYDRREALWQIERAIRPAGELFSRVEAAAAANAPRARAPQPLRPMTPTERVIADYEGTSLTIGPHPMAYRRAEMALRGVLPAADLPRARAGRRVRVAGAVITRQRPGTAKGFVFLTLEDETGIANVIVRPDVFDDYRVTVIEEPFLIVEGVLQQQDAVTAVRAERLYGLAGQHPEIASHDFH